MIEECVIRMNDKSNSTGAIDLFHSNPHILNCEIILNQGPAILSGANTESSPTISGNYIYHNNTTNQNMPQINLGTSDPETAIEIINNHIEGNYTMVGGIAVTTLAGGTIECIIQGNTIINNRYGITCYGFDINSIIDNNIIRDNNIQNQPMQGGSGINYWGGVSNTSLVSRNTISGNLWGITVTGDALPNLGQVEPDTINIGKNYFYNNGNEGVIYDLYNNSPNDIFAENNHWGTYNLDTIEMHIFHQPDDPSLGYVDYLPVKDYITEVPDKFYSDTENVLLYPNPAMDHFYIDFDVEEYRVSIFNYIGKKVLSDWISNPSEAIDISSLPKGVYVVEVKREENLWVGKLIRQ
ncbi:MAG: T9SS type A sorting domain-containing protein [Bacteroidales bacterium]